jgi:hypothetical protein
MNIIKINDSEFDTTSPTNNGFTKQYIKSFGDDYIDVDEDDV